MKFRMMMLAAMALATLTLGTGCANKEKAERDSLLKQNSDLSAQLEAEKKARADAEARAAAAANVAAAPTAAPTTPSMEGGTPDMSPLAGGGATGDLGGGVKRGKNELGEDTIQVSSDVLFDSGKATLKPTAKKALDKAVAVLKKEYTGRQIRIEGYTDPVPVKKTGWDDNWDLGAARARAVMLYLESKSVKNMYIASFGATKLKSTKDLAANRRVEIVVVKAGK